MRNRFLILIVVAAAFAVAAAVAKACEFVPSTVFCINGSTYTAASYSAAFDYSIAAEQGGFYVPTSELTEDVAEVPTGFDDDEYLPSEVGSDTEGLTLLTVSRGACAVAPPQENNVHLLYSGTSNDNAKVFNVNTEIAWLSSTPDHYDIGAAIKGATPTGTDAWSISGYGIVSTQHIPSGDVFTGQWLSDDSGVVVSFPGQMYPAGASPNALAILIAGPDGTGLHPIFAPPGS